MTHLFHLIHLRRLACRTSFLLLGDGCANASLVGCARLVAKNHNQIFLFGHVLTTSDFLVPSSLLLLFAPLTISSIVILVFTNALKCAEPRISIKTAFNSLLGNSFCGIIDEQPLETKCRLDPMYATTQPSLALFLYLYVQLSRSRFDNPGVSSVLQVISLASRVRLHPSRQNSFCYRSRAFFGERLLSQTHFPSLLMTSCKPITIAELSVSQRS